MGRASRKKANARAQRQPRQVSIYNPRSGQLEQHLVTISDASLAEWVRDRERLTAQGYPDRPPTYDDPKIRAWTNWGDMPGDPPSSIPAHRAGERFAQSWAVRHLVLGCDLKMLAFEMPRDGDFLLRHKIVTASGDVRHLGVQVPIILAAVFRLVGRGVVLAPIVRWVGCVDGYLDAADRKPDHETAEHHDCQDPN